MLIDCYVVFILSLTFAVEVELESVFLNNLVSKSISKFDFQTLLTT